MDGSESAGVASAICTTPERVKIRPDDKSLKGVGFSLEDGGRGELDLVGASLGDLLNFLQLFDEPI